MLENREDTVAQGLDDLSAELANHRENNPFERANQPHERGRIDERGLFRVANDVTEEHGEDLRIRA